eukprot:2394552-Amphidinium_carterae.1
MSSRHPRAVTNHKKSIWKAPQMEGLHAKGELFVTSPQGDAIADAVDDEAIFEEPWDEVKEADETVALAEAETVPAIIILIHCGATPCPRTAA